MGKNNVPEAIQITTHSDGCPGCREALAYLTGKMVKRENAIVVIAFEKGIPHFHTPVSPIQFEKLNRQYKLLK
jgi:hypothetical protein